MVAISTVGNKPLSKAVLHRHVPDYRYPIMLEIIKKQHQREMLESLTAPSLIKHNKLERCKEHIDQLFIFLREYEENHASNI